MNLWRASVDLRVESESDDIDTIKCAQTKLTEDEDPKATLRRALDLAWMALRNLEGDELLKSTLFLESLLRRTDILNTRDRDEVSTLIAIAHAWKDDVRSAVSVARTVLVRPEATRFRSILFTVIRFGNWRMRRFQSFYELSRPRFHRRSAIGALSHVINLSMEAAVEAEQLRFKLAERLAKEAIELSRQIFGPESNISLLATCVLANLAYEMGAIDEADLLIRGRIPAIEQYGMSETALLGFTVSAKLAIARGNPDLALVVLRKAQEIGIRRGWLRVVARCAADEVTIHIALGHFDLAEAVLVKTCDWASFLRDESDQSQLDAWPIEWARHRIELATGAYDSAAGGFARLRDRALNNNHLAWGIQLAVLLAGSLFMAGREEDAHEELLDALQLGADAGLFRTFVDELVFIEPCLRHTRVTVGAHLGYLNPYIASLLAAADPIVVDRRKKHLNQGDTYLLTTKETIILRLISLGLSNKSIARELRIAPETVKSHAKRIFIKLSTKTRAEAVARANELGVI